MNRISLIILLILCFGCHSTVKILKTSSPALVISGNDFYQMVLSMRVEQRDSFALKCIMDGNIPSFLKKFERIKISMTDKHNQQIEAILFVSKDYLSIGTNADWARVPLMPKTAQKIADAFNCFLPSRKIVNEIYKNSSVKLEPSPLVKDRDSSTTMLQHHQIIEQQRVGKSGLISGIKKDVVISGKLLQYPKNDRVAIYGWHKTDGNPIQPVYTGHVDWYVDYSHGIRLIYRKIKIISSNKKYDQWMDYVDILKNPILKNLLCDEENCGFYHY